MNSTQIAELRSEQCALLNAMYDASNAHQSDPLDSFAKHDRDTARADYDQIVKDIQLLHPMGANCPAHECDPELYSLYSDMHKDAYGFRYRGDMNILGIMASIPNLQADINDLIASGRERQDQMRCRDEADEAERLDEQATNDAYCTDFDHHDPRIQPKLATEQRIAVLSLCA